MYNKSMKNFDKKTKQMTFFEILLILFIICLYIVVKKDIIKIVPSCYILQKTGLLCPSCGGTRCIKELLNFNIVEALKMNAFYTITILYLLVLNIVYVLNIVLKTNRLKFLYIKKYHLIVWIIVLILYTIIRNIFFL